MRTDSCGGYTIVGTLGQSMSRKRQNVLEVQLQSAQPTSSRETATSQAGPTAATSRVQKGQQAKTTAGGTCTPAVALQPTRNERHCYSTEDTKGEVSTYNIRSIRVPGARYACSLSPGENAQQRCTSTYNAFTVGYRVTFLIFRKLNTLQHRKAAGTAVHRVITYRYQVPGQVLHTCRTLNCRRASALPCVSQPSSVS